MDGDVGPTVEDGVLHFLGEEAHPADLVQRVGAVDVASRCDEDEFELELRPLFENHGTHHLRLPASEPASPRGDA
jgi:hypothetical protein